jgi:hypothetical protein
MMQSAKWIGSSERELSTAHAARRLSSLQLFMRHTIFLLGFGAPQFKQAIVVSTDSTRCRLLGLEICLGELRPSEEDSISNLMPIEGRMALLDLAFKALYKGSKKFGIPSFTVDWKVFNLDPAERTRLLAEASDGFGKLFFAHHGRLVHKWIHYLEIYERHFAPYRNTPVKMLEIGVFKGGSLELWRDYFGADARIFGIDLDPECTNRVTPPNQVRIGSQANAKFLRSVVD